ncbi:MAG: PilT/PilU family type 4a pilus ATPase [Acidobacteria bacterium]|nr:PilT/PilU family type 4a pilus ATPase [Acidobacteriota bacterium]MBV9070313.1 PilT/PilU family type 4a pilus ATPase [Acidobacteriota bacterium]MBV9188173.1 PilT/PilU family type 4a pilus ATPase [Acidobacteriota bacterium]
MTVQVPSAPAEQASSFTLNDLLIYMAKQQASDLHLKPMRPPLLRIRGKLVPLKSDPLRPADLEKMLLPLLSRGQKEKFEASQSVDFGYGVPGVARFRANLYLQRGTVAGVFRRIPINVQTIDALDLPDAIRDLTQIPDGLVLVTGPTGSGKSTTLAAMISHISENEPLHIVTIEDPIEFLFVDKTAAISQREVGTDTPNFKEALRNAMRQDPDVIMVGEMRDSETVETVLTAAETGHLVFSTLHTNNAAQTIDRIIDTFPPDQHKQVRSQFALVLRGIISLKLIKTTSGALTAAVEILKNSPRVARLIEDGLTKDILEEMESSVGLYKMQSMNQSLIALLVHQVISYQDAMNLSSDADDLSLKVRKLFPQIEERVRQGGDMAPSNSDYSQITELMDIKRLYEEQEVHWRHRVSVKEEEIENLKHDMEFLRQNLQQNSASRSQHDEEVARLRSDNERLRADAQAKITQLQERIKELNQKLMAMGAVKK